MAATVGSARSSRAAAEPTADLAGRPLIAYPLAALAEAGIEAFVVAKPDTELPAVLTPAPLGKSGTDESSPRPRVHAEPESGPNEHPPEIRVVTEPAEPTHPLAGIVAALRHAGRPLVVLACDFPFAPPPLLRALAAAPEPLVVPAPGGEPQPLVARWSPELLPRLEAALDREEPLRRTVAALAPRLLDDADLARFGDPARAFLNVNTPADLRAAAQLL